MSIIRFLIVLGVILACGYYVYVNNDWSSMSQNAKSQVRPVQKGKIFDFEGARQKGLERQRKIDSGNF